MRYRDSMAFVKWDLGPLLGDFQALTETYFDLRFRINQELQAIQPISFNRTIAIPNRVLTTNVANGVQYDSNFYSGEAKFHGSIEATNIPQSITLPIILDEFGVNLRFTDLLELVPFSFLLSNVIPNITEFLDSQHPSRWFNANFVYDGWVIIKLHCTSRLNLSGTIADVSGSGFKRFQTSFAPAKKPELQWKFPGTKGLTDVIALLSTSFQSKKIINRNLKLSRRITFF